MDHDLSKPLRRAYELPHPGGDIDLYRGAGALDGEQVDELRIWLSTTRGLAVRWHTEALEHSVELGTATMSISHPELGLIDLPVDVNHSAGAGECPGTAFVAENITVVTTHWVNLPEILPARPLTDNRGSWAGRWSTESCGWRFTIDSRRNLANVLRAAKEQGEQFTVTHVGELRRVDGTEFDSSTAADVLFGWQLAMSLALGRWVAPALPVGIDGRGRRVWEQWAPWRCDAIRGQGSWWDTHTADDLSEFFDGYMRAYLDPQQRPVVRYVAMYLVSANHSGTTAEGKVMLAQAGLEYLAWVSLVLSGRLSPRDYKDMKASERLRLLLDEARIPLAVPSGLDGLAAMAVHHGFDGPEATAWVRNRLVHPKDAGEPYRIEGLVWQTLQLLLEYGELLLLFRLAYGGRFLRRYPPHRWAHSSEPVPWAATV